MAWRATLVVAALLAATPAGAKPFGPWGVRRGTFSPSQATALPRSEPTTTTDVVFLGAIRLYQRHLSPLKSFKCPSYPTCSRYALDSIQDYGVLRGTLMTLDRLFIRENAAMGSFLSLVRVDGVVRFYDPPAHNDLVSPLPFPRDFVRLDARW